MGHRGEPRAERSAAARRVSTRSTVLAQRQIPPALCRHRGRTPDPTTLPDYAPYGRPKQLGLTGATAGAAPGPSLAALRLVAEELAQLVELGRNACPHLLDEPPAGPVDERVVGAWRRSGEWS